MTFGCKSCVTEQQKGLSDCRILRDDYMRDITDVDNHEETVHRLSQLETEDKVLEDETFVDITSGFVVKTKWDKTHKVFLNVCSSDKMQPFIADTKVTRGQERELLYVLGPERLERDKGGASVPTFDVCFHPQVVEFAMARVEFRHMVVATCFDALENAMRDSRCKPRALLARKYHILKGVSYKSGDPVPMCLMRKDREVTETLDCDKKVKEGQATKKTKVDLLHDDITMLDDNELITATSNQADDPELTQVEQVDNSTLLIKERSSSDFDRKQKVEKLQQKKKLTHQLIYRGQFEHLHDVQADPNKQVSGDGCRPKELVVEVNFPLSTSAKGIDLDVSERMLRLSTNLSVVGDYEPLELALPFPVVEDKGYAKFDRKKRKLVVTLPVQPPPKLKPHSVSLIVWNDDEEEKEEEVPRNKVATLKSSKVFGENDSPVRKESALMVANGPQAMAHNQHKAQRHPRTAATRSSQAVMTELAAIKDDVFDDMPPLKSCGSEEIDTSELRAEETESSRSMSVCNESASEAVVDSIKPPFETHDTLKCLSYIVNVAGIDSASVKLTLPSNRSLHLQFLDSDKQVYEMHVTIVPVDIDPSTAAFDVASENMVVILHKKYAVTASTA